MNWDFDDFFTVYIEKAKSIGGVIGEFLGILVAGALGACIMIGVPIMANILIVYFLIKLF